MDIKIHVTKGRLRLVWTHNKQRYFLPLRLSDEPVNRLLAEQKILEIKGDILSNNFDPTLEKYKSPKDRLSSITVLDLFEEFWRTRPDLSYSSMQRYKGLHKKLKEILGPYKLASSVTDSDVKKFKSAIAERGVLPETVREKIYGCSSCWNYGIRKGYVKTNPWAEIAQSIKAPPRQKSKPFTREEVNKILTAVNDDRVFSYYKDYIEFTLSSGCRLGEAAALCWKHFNEDCSVVWFGESIDAQKNRKSTKTNKARYVGLTPQLQQMLIDRRGNSWSEDGLVFPAKRGNTLNLGYFSFHIWTPLLEKAGVEHREARKMRSTWISHSIQRGMSPLDAADIAGNSAHIIYKNYLGSIVNRQQLPNLWNKDEPT